MILIKIDVIPNICWQFFYSHCVKPVKKELGYRQRFKYKIIKILSNDEINLL